MTDLEARLEIYRIWVETITAAERRRQFVSAAYAALALAPITVAGVLPDVEILYIATPLYFLSLLWWGNVHSFRRLAVAKFRVLDEMEENLPLAPFRAEWRLLKSSPVGLGGTWPYMELTMVEKALPAVLIVVSSMAIVGSIGVGFRPLW